MASRPIYTAAQAWVFPKKKNWPPFAKPDRDATVWFNTNNTRSNHLFNALCYFICAGWPVEALDEFLTGIKPEAGWEEEWTIPKEYIPRPGRVRDTYSPAVFQLFSGYWEPAQPPKGKKK